MLKPSAHVDAFARERLPPPEQWPELIFTLPELQFPDRLNCGEELLDKALREIDAKKLAIVQGDRAWSYSDLAAATNRYAHALVDDLGVKPGGRVLLRGANTPDLFALWLAIMKVGAIAVCTVPMLRARELSPVIEKAEVALALCQHDLTDELAGLVGATPLKRLVTYGRADAELDALAQHKFRDFKAVQTSSDDVCLIAFTSGTTGQPKGCIHFHRDVMAMCHTFSKHMLSAGPDSIFIGTPPIAFTFGLGALLVFPLYHRAAIALPMHGSPAGLISSAAQHRATHIFTSPTAYRAMQGLLPQHDLSAAQVCVSAGEYLPQSVSDSWFATTGKRIVDGIGATEMIHIFISACGEAIRPGATGKAVPGYVATLLDDAGAEIDGAGAGRLAVRGPVGCRYLSDDRQLKYVVNGWNVTGDLYRRDEDGYFWFVSRADDMIVSSGYNISGPEVEAALVLHPAVEECAVIGWPDPERGQIVKAVVVPRKDVNVGPELVLALQDHVKNTLAPYKYPRAIEFCAALPKTSTGKLQRSALRAPTP